ncbi:hypothetical protein [Neobacillus sp. LXY-4]|uniref:hypothetical protein n=1 Tax=Neobacillus sp. LXY-4 TaxID=3379826 RepID=UPI003EE30E25
MPAKTQKKQKREQSEDECAREDPKKQKREQSEDECALKDPKKAETGTIRG